MRRWFLGDAGNDIARGVLYSIGIGSSARISHPNRLFYLETIKAKRKSNM